MDFYCPKDACTDPQPTPHKCLLLPRGTGSKEMRE